MCAEDVGAAQLDDGVVAGRPQQTTEAASIPGVFPGYRFLGTQTSLPDLRDEILRYIFEGSGSGTLEELWITRSNQHDEMLQSKCCHD